MRKNEIGKQVLWVLLVLALLPGFYLGRAFFTGDMDQDEVASAQERQDGEKAGKKLALLSWPVNLDAVRYEVEIYDGAQKAVKADRPVKNAAYRNLYVYTNQLVLPARQFDGRNYLYRVRSYDLDGRPIGNFSQPRTLGTHLKPLLRNAPVPRQWVTKGNGTALLYPVYAYAGNPGAAKYEVEVTSQYPENSHGVRPSRFRIFSEVTELTDLYDKFPRPDGCFWRVRGLTKDGQPVGEWSRAVAVPALDRQGYTVGIYGDSISHGGGHLSFSPVDFAYSYAHYLDFPTVNLSESGDTSAMLVQRFERDAAPFRVKYLLIMGGTNSLRAGTSAQDVISDLKTLQSKAREYGMQPILLTLLPINPKNIEKAFHEPTAPGWEKRFAEVNAFIRTQPHMDTAAPFAKMGGTLPTSMGLDGLHGDYPAKKIIGDVINRDIKHWLH